MKETEQENLMRRAGQELRLLVMFSRLNVNEQDPPQAISVDIYKQEEWVRD